VPNTVNGPTGLVRLTFKKSTCSFQEFFAANPTSQLLGQRVLILSPRASHVLGGIRVQIALDLK